MARHVARVQPAGHAPLGRQGAVQVSSRGRHVEIPGPPDLAPAPDLHQVRRDRLQRPPGRVRHYGPAQVHARSSLAAGHPLRIELELETSKGATATARSLAELLMDDQIEQRPQLVLDRLEHTLVQITRLVAFRNVQQ